MRESEKKGSEKLERDVSPLLSPYIQTEKEREKKERERERESSVLTSILSSHSVPFLPVTTFHSLPFCCTSLFNFFLSLFSPFLSLWHSLSSSPFLPFWLFLSFSSIIRSRLMNIPLACFHSKEFFYSRDSNQVRDSNHVRDTNHVRDFVRPEFVNGSSDLISCFMGFQSV